MARKYSRDNAGRFASGGGGRSSGGASGGASAGGKKKAAAPVAAAPKKKHPGPPPPAWSKEMLAAKAKGDRASKAKAAAAKPVAAKVKARATTKAANAIKPSSLRANAAEKAAQANVATWKLSAKQKASKFPWSFYKNKSDAVSDYNAFNRDISKIDKKKARLQSEIKKIKAQIAATKRKLK
jgi:hypothetical protein